MKKIIALALAAVLALGLMAGFALMMVLDTTLG